MATVQKGPRRDHTVAKYCSNSLHQIWATHAQPNMEAQMQNSKLGYPVTCKRVNMGGVQQKSRDRDISQAVR
jgi:hypothetical protein